MQLDTFAPPQLDSCQANRIGTSRRSGGKHTMRPIVGRWRAEQFVPTQFELRGTIEFPDDDEVREALNVGEPRLKLGQDLEHTIGLVFSAKTLGNFACVLVGATYKSNWTRNMGRRPPVQIVNV